MQNLINFNSAHEREKEVETWQEKAQNTFNWARTKITSTVLQVVASLTSRETQQMAVSSVVFTSTVVALLVSSILIYVVFYFLSMPTVSKNVPCYLDYSLRDGASLPTAHLDLNQAFDEYQGLIMKPTQRYNLGLELVVPDTENNFAIGNFMVSMELVGKNNKTLTTVSRPAHLKYKSPFLRYLSTAFSCLSLVLDRSLESSTVAVPLVKNHLESSTNPVRFVRISLGNAKLETYSSYLLVDTHFQGLAYFMHHWWLSTALFFISNIMLVEILIASYVWNLITASLSHPEATADESVQAPTGSGESVVSSEQAAPTLVTLADRKSDESSNENSTLDGDSLSEVEIEPEVLTGMLKNGPSSSSMGGFAVSRQSAPAIFGRQPSVQSGNFSYPHSRDNRTGQSADASVPDPAATRASDVAVPDVQDGRGEPSRILADDSTFASASSLHFEDSTIHDEYSEEFDMNGLLDKDDLHLL
ncbi:hypothetical protein HDV03_000224 [Kappamyces sp. JEL0829]|nr:hypothetical protein HDV03_000224 [Kappamyces sp. JEL0829]